MRTVSINITPSPIAIPLCGNDHVWTEQELREECMTVDESQQDLHQMIHELFDQKEQQYAGVY